MGITAAHQFPNVLLLLCAVMQIVKQIKDLLLIQDIPNRIGHWSQFSRLTASHQKKAILFKD